MIFLFPFGGIWIRSLEGILHCIIFSLNCIINSSSDGSTTGILGVNRPRLSYLKKDHFSRMRSEGFPFIVGVWGWTCVRFVLLPRRRLVVVSSSPRRRQLVNSLPLGGTFALRHHPVFQSMKSGGSLARNAHFGAPKSQNVRSFSCFA